MSFSVEVAQAEPSPASHGGTVGVDLGVKSLAVLSTGEAIANPKHLEAAQNELRRLQRTAARRAGPDKRTGRKPSNRWRATQARISKLHTAVAHARTDGLHKLSTRLVEEFDTIVVEDLNVAGMVRNRTLTRAVSDVGMGELRRQLDYKTRWHGRGLVVADRFYPSSKTCSDCGVVKAKLRLSERTFTCEHCGHTADRDLNAARNLAHLAETAGSTSSPSCGATTNEPAGNPRKTSSLAPGTATRRPAGSTPRSNTTAQEHTDTFPARMTPAQCWPCRSLSACTHRWPCPATHRAR
ncbi:hypothetical protein GCM10027563_21790 [Parasphingorhabdus pacifica]